MEDILAQVKKVAEAAEVFVLSSEETPVQFEANRLKHIQSKHSRSVALRIIRGSKIGYASTTKLDDRRELVDMAVESAEFGMPARVEWLTLTKTGMGFPMRDLAASVTFMKPMTEQFGLAPATSSII